jgi:hypothetical protein
MTFIENIAYLNYFGFRLTFWKTVNTLMKKSRGKIKIAWRIHDKNNEVIEEYIKKVCPATYEKLRQGCYDVSKGNVSMMLKEVSKETSLESAPLLCEDIEKNNTIWVLWWQGENQAPPLVRECIAGMRRHSNGHPVIVLDKDNYKNYVKLPQIIETRFSQYDKDNSLLKKWTLDITKKSNIIRTYLLYYYGGLWCDATIMMTKDVTEDLFTEQWSTLGQDNNWYIGRGKWSTFFMGATAGNGFVKYNYDTHIEYWTHKKYYVHYLMTDHMFDIAAKERTALRRMVDEVKTGNKKCLTVNHSHETACEKSEAEEFFRHQRYHKLSWKWWGREADSPVKLHDDSGNLTWFGYLYKHYMREEKA